MASNNPVVLAAIVGYGLFLWLALYLLVRASLRSQLILLSVLGLIGQAAYFFAAALTDSLSNPAQFVALERWTWWTSVLPLAVWFHLSASISQPIRRPDTKAARVPASALGGYVVAIVITAVGSLTNWFNNYADADLTIRAGPAYSVYIIFQLTMTVGALLHFVRARTVLRARSESGDVLLTRQLSLLIGGSLLFILGALWLGLRYLFALSFEATLGYLLLFVAVALLGYGVAHYGLLLDGRNIQRDFFYTFSGILLLNIIYVLLLRLVADVSTAGLLALVSLVTLTHTAFDSGRSWLDRLFFTQDEQAARAEAREYATALGTEPVASPLPAEAEAGASIQQIEGEAAPDEATNLKTFKADVRRALTNLKNPPRLVNSPLLTLRAVGSRLATNDLPDNRLNRVAVLRELLVEQIEGLRPELGEGARVGEAWRFYNVLHYPYVRELSRKGALTEARRLRNERVRSGNGAASELEQVLEWLADVDEDTFYKWQRRASDTIAEALWEEEARMKDEG